MEILKINQLPSPSEVEKIIYNEKKAKEDAFLDWCIFQINTALSKHSEAFLKNNSITISLWHQDIRKYDFEFPNKIGGEICKSLYDLGYKSYYAYFPIHSSIFDIELTLGDSIKINESVFVDENNGWDKENKRWKKKYEGRIYETNLPEYIFKKECHTVSSSLKEHKDMIIYRHNGEGKLTFIDDYNYIVEEWKEYSAKEEQRTFIQRVINNWIN